ncbi:transglycosylase domain-containing protein [Thermospira aquatica]|uniref:peptidoglycan glycosyltransferase n=1 Tax=Thermospira aquatica TaxID=2828656 RepID=A0AAX3BAB5_9SPIR|nr:transglycosylase domain-containing protein [Thermospira aquatica]URA09193.1 transglycosylase domain-containing protein [Thermospira aquatica]
MTRHNFLDTMVRVVKFFIFLKNFLKENKNHLWVYMVLVLGGIFTVFSLWPYPPDELSRFSERSIKVYDRHGHLLMEMTPEKGGLCKKISLCEVPQDFIELLLFSEDRTFFSHKGWRPSSLLRATFQNVKKGRIVSGGSTLTQQLVRMRRGKMRNTLWSKFTEILEAYRLEQHFSKEEILEAYINTVFLGNHIYGFEKAAEIYFRKSLQSLNLLEMSALIAMIPAPSKHQPYRSGMEFTIRARKLLRRAWEAHILSFPQEMMKTYEEMWLHVYPMEQRVYAPLFCLYALQEAKKYVPASQIAEIYTTFDLEMYTNIRPVIFDVLKSLETYNAKHASLVMIDNPTSELRVMVGSLDFFDEEKGMINATLIRKQVGSVMKPFAYALAMENSLYHPSSILPDIYQEYPAAIGRYIPKNFTRTYHGPVRLAVALASSYNVSAVHVAATIGIEPFYFFLKRIGFDSLVRNPAFYGLGLVLGNANLTLLELAQGYTIFPKEGIFQHVRSLRFIMLKNGRRVSLPTPKSEHVLSRETCFLISRILSEHQYKFPAFGINSPIYFPFPVAVKTGTTKDFRDNCVVGYTPLITTAVWVGNLYEEPMQDLAAVAGAGKVLRNVMLLLWNQGFPFPPFRASNMTLITQRICVLSGMIAHQGCKETTEEIFVPSNLPQESCTWHTPQGETVVPPEYQSWAEKKQFGIQKPERLEILFPKDGAVFGVDTQIPEQYQSIPLEAMGNGEITWFCDGEKIGKGTKIFWTLRPGEHVIEAVWNDERKRVRILVLER